VTDSTPDNSGNGGGSGGNGDSGRAARLLDGSAGDSSGSSGSSGGSDTPPGFQEPPDTVSDSTPDNSGNGGGSGGNGDSGRAARMLDGSTGGSDSGGSDGPSGGQGIGPPGVSGSATEGETGEPGAFDPDATKTGELEATGEGAIGEQARSLEQQVAGQQISDLSENLNASGAELRPEDVQVTRDGDQLQAELSPVGRERVQFIAGRQQEQQAEIAVERELNRPVASSDVTVSDGEVQVSDDLRREVVQERSRSRNTDVSPRTPATGFPESESSVQRNRDGTVTEDVFGQRVTFGDAGQTLVGLNDPNQDITDSLTAGENTGIASDAEERQIRQDIQQRRAFFGVGDEVSGFVRNVTGSETAATAGRALGDLPGVLAGATAGATLAVDTAAEAAENAPRTVGEFGAIDTGAAAVNTATSGTRGAVSQFREDPVYTGTLLAGEAAVSLGAGRLAGSAARLGRDRVRTAGSTDITDDVMSEDVRRFQETGGAEGERFPGADTPALYRSNPARGVRQQADANTPDALEQRFAEQGVTEGSVLKKAIDAEPEGPGRGRSAQGMRSPEADSEQAGQFELQGNFVGPEVSPNFLRIDSRSPSFSFRPGLPETGDRPTVQAVRTRVENPDADRNTELDTELQETSDTTTARTKPPGEVNEGEIEAVLPPGSEFTDIGGRGVVGETARALGIGSDFRIEIGGRRVPVRPAAPEAEIDATGAGRVTNALREFAGDDRGTFAAGRRGDGPDTDTAADTDANAGRTATRRGAGNSRRSRIDAPERPVDRPAPTFAGGGAASGGSSATESDTSPTSSGLLSSRGLTSPGASGGSSASLSGPSSPFFGGGSTGSPGGSGGGSSTGGPGGGGGGSGTSSPPPGSPGGSRGPSTPPAPPETPPRRPPNFDGGGNSDEEERASVLQGVQAEQITNFRNPLTGEVLITEDDE